MKAARTRGLGDGARAAFLMAWPLAAPSLLGRGEGVVLYVLTRSVRVPVQPKQVSLLRRSEEGSL